MVSPRATRYSPNFEMVENRLPQIGGIFGQVTVDRFDENDINSPMYIKPPAGDGAFDGSGHFCERIDPEYQEKFKRKAKAKEKARIAREASKMKEQVKKEIARNMHVGQVTEDPEGEEQDEHSPRNIKIDLANDVSHESIFPKTAVKRGPFESKASLIEGAITDKKN